MITVNGLHVEPTHFPDGTTQVWKLPEAILSAKMFLVEWDFEFEAEFITLIQLKALLDDIDATQSIDLHMPYLPYGRQDKSISNNTTFGLIPFANIINDLYFDHVTALDAHSAAGSQLFHRFISLPIKPLFDKVQTILRPSLICFPDKGAATKYHSITEIEQLDCEKTRDAATGIITGYKLLEPAKANNSHVLIVDDICDGGATFVYQAKLLYEAGAKEVNLLVTHGIFSKGLKPLRDANIKRVFTRKGEAFAVKDNVRPWQVSYQPYFQGETKDV